jgi:LacI family sucrose operon transcriptional repressor
MTIKEVAQMAGVSSAAVSRYLNGGSLSQEKRDRIQKVIEETGYRPSTAAQVLRTGRMKQIGVIVPKLYSDSVSQIMEGISERAAKQGYMVVVCNTGGEEENEIRFLELMENNQAAGVIIMGTVMTARKESMLKKYSLPVVVTGQNYKGIPCIYHNDESAVRELTELIVKKGRKRIAYLGVNERDERAGALRRKGFQSAVDAAEKELQYVYTSVGEFTPDSGYNNMAALFREDPQIDGVVCATDTIAMGAMRAIRQAGRTIGDDISIVGVGDSWVDNFSETPLTTAHFYFKQCGTGAAEMLLSIIEGTDPAAPVRQTCLEYTIVERGSI